MAHRGAQPSPFDAWRSGQELLTPERPIEARSDLDPARQGKLDLAIWDIIDATPDRLAEAIGRAVELRERLYAEHLAELGDIPATVDGCIAVLAAAATILETIGPEGIAEIMERTE